MDIHERFSGNLLRLRKQADLSQEELATRASLHRTEISKLENRERLPRLDTVIKLAGALSIPSARLMDGMAWEPGRSEEGKFNLGPAGLWVDPTHPNPSNESTKKETRATND